MSDATEFHNKAMDLAEEAAIERAMGNLDHAKELYAAAFEFERKAAKEFEQRHNMEPTRSVLFRSAASLAMECGDVKSAEKMIAQGLRETRRKKSQMSFATCWNKFIFSVIWNCVELFLLQMSFKCRFRGTM
jgi:DNA-binding MurR/RpiR family transcriptional regulator